MDILSQSSLLVAIVSFALGCSVLARNVRNKLYIAFAIVCVLVTGWALFFFLAKVWDNPRHYRIHLLFHIWLAPAALSYIRTMVRSQSLSRALPALSLLMAIALSVSLVFGAERHHPTLLQIIYFTPGFIAVQALQLMWLDRRARKRGRNVPKRSFIYLGGLAVLLLSVLDHVPWAGPVIPVVGNIALAFYLIFLGQAATQQRFLNFGAAFSRFLVILGVAFTLTGLYSLLFAWIEGKFGLFLLNSFIVSFLVLTLLEPIQKMVAYLTGRLMSKKHRLAEEELRKAQRRLAAIVDPNALHRDVLETIRAVLEPDWGALFVLRLDGTLYRRAQTIGQEPAGSGAPFELLSGHLLLAHCLELRHKGQLPIILDQAIEAEIERSASKAQRGQLTALLEGMRALECNLLIPLFDESRVLAFATLRISGPPEAWGNNWGILQILYPYFEQAGATMRSMDVYVRSREKERLAELGEMAAGLAHEIRNPLGAIKGAAQFLDPDANKPESRFLRVIVEEVDRLNTVVTQFLEYSKPRPLKLQTVDAGQLASRTIEIIRPTLQGVGLEFVPPAQPAPVRVAPEQIQQVLLNLLQNAINALATRPGPDNRVQVRVRADGRGDSGLVVIEVEDNGPGITDEIREKIFVPFFTTRPSGTGLGLSICQKIIEAHRGRIELNTQVGAFARFSVILPMAESR